MEQINIMEAARRCKVSDKTIRRAIAAGKLPVHRPKSNVALVMVSDLEAWHQLSLDATEQRLATMEQRIKDLEQQVRHLTSRVATLSPARITKPRITELPDYLESLYGFIIKHGVAQNEVRRLIKENYIHVVTGKWTTPKGRLEEALDQEGRREFWVQLHNHDGFLSCDDCPHSA